MVNQLFLQCNDNYIFCVTRSPSNKIIKGAVLLIPGFGESKCDIDYFMSNIAKDLVQNSFYVLQIDLYGHGDSEGSFDTLDSNIIIDNIRSALDYLKKNLSVPIYIVTRGFYNELIYDNNILNEIEGVVCISPIKLFLSEFNKITYLFSNIKGNIIELPLCFDKKIEQEELKKFLIMLGAEPGNMWGQKISTKFINQILQNIKAEKWQYKKKYSNIIWITMNPSSRNININYNYNDISYNTLDYYEGYGFPRDITWQYILRKNVIASIIRLNKGRI